MNKFEQYSKLAVSGLAVGVASFAVSGYVSNNEANTAIRCDEIPAKVQAEACKKDIAPSNDLAGLLEIIGYGAAGVGVFGGVLAINESVDIF